MPPKVHPFFANFQAKKASPAEEAPPAELAAAPSAAAESSTTTAVEAAPSRAAVLLSSPVAEQPPPPPVAVTHAPPAKRRSRSPPRPAEAQTGASAAAAIDVLEQETPAVRPSQSSPASLADAIARMQVPAASTLATLMQKTDYRVSSAGLKWPLPPATEGTAAADDPLPFAYVADVLSDISATGSRLGAVVLLSRLYYHVLVRCPADLLCAVNLTVNRLAPAHEGLELGVGDAILQKAICESCGMDLKTLRAEYQACGDLAEVAQNKKSRLNTLIKTKLLTARAVFANFKTIATFQGKDVQRRRVDTINALLRSAVGPEVNFIVRALQGKMRIGIADSSVLMALGIAFAVKHLDGELAGEAPDVLMRVATFSIEGVTRAYHEVPSFDVVLPVIVRNGLASMVPGADARLSIRAGIPVKPMLAHATNGITAILDRFVDKEFTCEYKYDGERAQIHYCDGKFSIFSRNSENHTDKYPDVIVNMPKSFDTTGVQSFIMDSEVVAIDKETGKLLAFQVLQHRGRKNIKLEDVTIEVSLFAFDLLLFNGQSLLSKPLRERRQVLRANFSTGKHFRFASNFDGSDTTEIQSFLDASIADGCEGLMVKTLDVDAEYTPFKRSYHWLKLKKDYVDGAGDTLDLIVMGAYHGKGKRTGVYGGYLLGCYDPETEEVQSVCKIGTGFKDDDLDNLSTALQAQIVASPPPYYRFHDNHRPDVWFTDSAVWEVKCADLTISPTHQAAFGLVDEGKGIALRFPRFIKVRDDKGPSDATSAMQVAFMYRQQALAQKKLQEEQNAKLANSTAADGYDY